MPRPQTPLDGPGLAPVLMALTHILDGHMPYPAIVVDLVRADRRGQCGAADSY